MRYLLGSDLAALTPIILALVTTGITSLIALLIFFWWIALFDIGCETTPNQTAMRQ